MGISRRSVSRSKNPSSDSAAPAMGGPVDCRLSGTMAKNKEAACMDVLHQVIRRFHSEVGSPLAAIGLRLEMMRHTSNCDVATKKTLEEMGTELEAVVDAVRASLKILRELEKDVSAVNR